MAPAPQVAATAMVPKTPPPFVHAIGGSAGSALALLMLYPLERARIEMQSQAAAETPKTAARPVQGSGIVKPPPDTAAFMDSRIGAGESEREHKESSEKSLVHSPIVSEAGNSTDSFELVSLGKAKPINDGVEKMPLSPFVPTLENKGGGHGATHGKEPLVLERLSTITSGGDRDDEGPFSSSVHFQQYETDESCETNGPDDQETEERRTRAIEPGLLPCLVRLYRRGELYRGVKPVVSTLAISNFVFFYALQVTKRYIVSGNRHGQNLLRESTVNTKIRSLLSSSIAGVFNVLVTNPLWVANLRIVQEGMPTKNIGHRSRGMRKEPTLSAVMRDIIKKEGFGQLWSGTWASLVLVSNPAIQFFLYEQLKIYLVSSRFKRRRETGALGLLSLSAVEAFVVGAVAKGVATIITYPLQLAQVLLRLQKNQDANGIEGNSGSNSRGYTGTLDCIIQLSRNGGLQNLFSGMSAKLLQTVLTAAFTFLTYEQIVAAVQRTYMSLVFQR